MNKTKKVDILYCKLNESFNELSANYYNFFHKDMKEKSNKFLRWQDKQAYILGKFLLMKWLETNNYDPLEIRKVKYTKYGRPYLDLDIDFNISHSGEYVIMAVGSGLRLGIDIEACKDINFNCFDGVFTVNERSALQKSLDKKKLFYQFWTKKEALVKANGRGLSIPLKEVDVVKNETTIFLRDEYWFLKQIVLDEDYELNLAYNHKNIVINNYSIKF